MYVWPKDELGKSFITEEAQVGRSVCLLKYSDNWMIVYATKYFINSFQSILFRYLIVMSANGMYVRAPDAYMDEEESELYVVESQYSDDLNSCQLGANEVVGITEPIDTDGEGEPQSAEEVMWSTEDDPNATIMEENQKDACSTNAHIDERLDRLERMMLELASSHTTSARNVPVEQNEIGWGFAKETGSQGAGYSSIRMETIPPFPKDVPANKLWEAWQEFLENFEIAVSLSHPLDPVRRAKLLFVSMGRELQGIVRAAKLRPNLNEATCYSTFVENIDRHLKAMTDTSAEHEAFTSMKQEKGESAVSFHSRLMEKVRLCGYSPSDQERFVRAQLLKGLANRELAKLSRTFGYETNFVVQSATRDEAYDRETRHEAPDVYAITQTKSEPGANPGPAWKRPRTNESNRRAVHARDNFRKGRRFRCSRCNRLAHNGGPCPALGRKCRTCGMEGHFAAACRDRRKTAGALRREERTSNDAEQV